MSASRPFLAQTLKFEIVPQWNGLSPTSREFLVILGVGILIGLVALVWAALLHKERRRSRRRLHHHSHRGAEQPTLESAGEPVGDGTPRKRRRWRRRRRDHRPRNPTLAETGGLPPIRPERPPEPFP